MEGQLVPQYQWCVSKASSMQYTGSCLPAFQGTRSTPKSLFKGFAQITFAPLYRYVADQLKWKHCQTKKLGTEKERPAFKNVVEDVKALYPSLCRDTMTKALEYALKKHSIFNTKTRKIDVETEQSLP